MITIKDIAKEANVSEGTVDRVLHKRGGVSKNTEARIQEILKKHDFKVNPVARALALKNKYKLAILMPSFNEDNLFFKGPYSGILKASGEVKNIGVAVSNYFFDQFDGQSYLEQFEVLMKSAPSAVVLVPTFVKETKIIIERLESLKIPYLFFNIDLQGFNNISFIGQDSYMGGYVAGKLMSLSLGKQSSVLIVNTTLNITNYHATSKRVEGFNDYFLKNDIEINTSTLSIDNFDQLEETKLKINSFLAKNKTIRGVFVPSSRIAAVAEALDDETIAHIELIGFDNTEPNLKCLETDKVSFLISQKPFEQGFEAVQLMSDYLVNGKLPAPIIYSPIEILTKENARYNQRTEKESEQKEG